MVHLKGSHLRSLSFRVRVLHPNTRVNVRLLGPCFKTGRLQPLCQHPRKSASLSLSKSHFALGYNTPKGYIPWAFIRPLKPMLALLRKNEPIDDRLNNHKRVWPQALPFQQFHVLFNSLFKVLFIFRSLYLCAIGLWPIFSLRWNLPPILSCIPKQLDSSKEQHMD